MKQYTGYRKMQGRNKTKPINQQTQSEIDIQKTAKQS
jgi:hypothetical protein